MRRFAFFSLIEACLIGAGVGADRMAPDWIPTWAIWSTVAVCLALSGLLYWWDKRDAKTQAEEVKDAVREALQDHDVEVRGIKDAIKSLPKIPLGDGHQCAALPDGTTIVTMADGTIRLAMPKRIKASATGTISGVMSASPIVRKAHDDD